MNRRKLIRDLGLGIASGSLFSFDPPTSGLRNFLSDRLDKGVVKDEKFWKKFSKTHYQVSTEFVNLENGYFGVQPKVVNQAYLENIRTVNMESSRYMRTRYNEDYRKIVSGLAKFAGTDDLEILITRNATEAMNIIIQGLDLKAGDEVILHRQDYFSMIETFQMLERQKSIRIRYVEIPLIPKSDEEIINIYQQAVSERTKCILVTHLLHMTGQIMPVSKFVSKFRLLGIDVIVDAAHSFAQLDFKIPDLQADFVGVNLHKWFGNPLGAGMLYVRKSRIRDLKPLFGDHGTDEEDIRKLGHFGTMATPIVMTIPTAQQFNEMVTLPVKESRLRLLQNYWTTEAKSIAGVKVTTPTEKSRSCALASFKIDGLSAEKVVERLFKEHGIFTVIRKLPDDEVVRVTPNLYNVKSELDQLLQGIAMLAKRN